MARPRKEVAVTTEQYINDLAEKQCSKVEIAAKLNISIDTFDRHYAEIYSKGKEIGRAKLRQKLYGTAMSGNVTAMIFCAKNWLGMSDKQSLELTGRDGGPVQHNLSALNDVELAHLESILTKASEPESGESGDRAS